MQHQNPPNLSSEEYIRHYFPNVSLNEENTLNYLRVLIEDICDPSTIKTIPKIIHIIWLGGEVPLQYWLSLKHIAALAHRDGFTICIWVDDINNCFKTVCKHDGLEVYNLRVCHIEELLMGMEQDIFYQEGDRLKQFMYCFNRELVGNKNYAAASDLLRYEILRQIGGYYFDTDTDYILDAHYNKTDQYGWPYNRNLPKFKKNIKLIPDQTLLGARIPISGEGMNNDRLAAVPHHPIFMNALLLAFEHYKQFDIEKPSAQNRRTFEWTTGYNYHKQLNKMDLKRFPYFKPFSPKQFDLYKRIRLESTCEATGPICLGQSTSAFKRYICNGNEWFSTTEKTKKGILSLEGLGSKGEYSLDTSKHRVAKYTCEMMNIKINSVTDGTWLKEMPTKNYDTNSMANRFFSPKEKITKALKTEIAPKASAYLRRSSCLNPKSSG